MNQLIINLLGCLILSFAVHCDNGKMETNQEQCSLYFGKTGIKDFRLNSSYEEISEKIKLNEEVSRNGEVMGYHFSETIELFNEEKEVSYFFNFKNNNLIFYSFEIKASRKNYFKFIVDILKNDSSITFIKKETYVNSIKTDNCEKFLRLKRLKNESYIYGGISYF